MRLPSLPYVLAADAVGEACQDSLHGPIEHSGSLWIPGNSV